MKSPVSSQQLARQLHSLGVRAGDLLVVHTAFSEVGPVEGGPEGFIHALLQAVGPTGTLMMPSLADHDALFDPAATPCRDMGVVADTFWRLPGVMRSDNPHAFAAQGPLAEQLLAPHSVVVPHGPDSPPGRAIVAGGKVLLAGVGHDANTTIHVAENVAGVGYGFEARSVVRLDGALVELRYREVDHCCRGFERVGDELRRQGWQSTGLLGHAEALLAPSARVFEAASALLGRDAEALLCPRGQCNYCDAARKAASPDDHRHGVLA
jgi:aminoglycoside 3-N-acetyltransferase